MRAERAEKVSVDRKKVLTLWIPCKGTTLWEPLAYKIMICFTPLELVNMDTFPPKILEGVRSWQHRNMSDSWYSSVRYRNYLMYFCVCVWLWEIFSPSYLSGQITLGILQVWGILTSGEGTSEPGFQDTMEWLSRKRTEARTKIQGRVWFGPQGRKAEFPWD